MGLDMYLHKRIWVGSASDGEMEFTGVPDRVEPDKVSYIVQDVGYWRKANAIHRWFVEHVQDGIDNCGTYSVSLEQLRTLLEAVERVLDASGLVEGKVINGCRFKDGKEEPIVEDGMVIKDPTIARTLLPTQEGFFFGSTEYDKWYIEDLKKTKAILTNALADPDGEFAYSSSW